MAQFGIQQLILLFGAALRKPHFLRKIDIALSPEPTCRVWSHFYLQIRSALTFKVSIPNSMRCLNQNARM